MNESKEGKTKESLGKGGRKKMLKEGRKDRCNKVGRKKMMEKGRKVGRKRG